jgi:hypothetical protein
MHVATTSYLNFDWQSEDLPFVSRIYALLEKLNLHPSSSFGHLGFVFAFNIID